MSLIFRLLQRSKSSFSLKFPRFPEKKTDPVHRFYSKMARLRDVQHRTLNVNSINMHVAEMGSGGGGRPVVLFLHGFPELWYTWRHQMAALSSLGYRTVAPDLRGYGDTEAPEGVGSYTSFHTVGDVVGLIDDVAGGGEEGVLMVGHDWGAMIAWQLCLYRPDRVKALINMSVVFSPRNPKRIPIPTLRALYGDDYYICRFQEPGDIEEEFTKIGTRRVLEEFLTYRNPGPLNLPKGKCFNRSPDTPVPLPSWLTEEDLMYYVSMYEKTGFAGGINYYRNLDRNWELMAPWAGAKVKVPVKFIIGDQDLTYHAHGAREYIHSGGFKRDVPLLEEALVMEGLGHFLHEEKPDEISKHISDFFGKFH